jgi:hypothetical protein
VAIFIVQICLLKHGVELRGSCSVLKDAADRAALSTVENPSVAVFAPFPVGQNNAQGQI